MFEWHFQKNCCIFSLRAVPWCAVSSMIFPHARINAHALKQSARYKNERPRSVSTGEEVELQLARCDVQPSAVFLHPTAPSLTVDVRESRRKTRTAVVFCWEVIIRARPCLTWCWSLRVSFRLFCLLWSAAALQVACVYSSECKSAFFSQHAAVCAVELGKLFVFLSFQLLLPTPRSRAPYPVKWPPTFKTMDSVRISCQILRFCSKMY